MKLQQFVGASRRMCNDRRVHQCLRKLPSSLGKALLRPESLHQVLGSCQSLGKPPSKVASDGLLELLWIAIFKVLEAFSRSRAAAAVLERCKGLGVVS